MPILHPIWRAHSAYRQVKCDGRPNGCRNCERLQLECVGDDGTASAKRASAVSLRKIRTYRSCTTCRLSKTKCDGDRPICGRCAAKHVECIYDGGAAPRWTRNFGKTSIAPSVDSGISDTRESTSASGERESSKSEKEPRIPPRLDGPSTATSDAGADHNGATDYEDTSFVPDINSWYGQRLLAIGFFFYNCMLTCQLGFFRQTFQQVATYAVLSNNILQIFTHLDVLPLCINRRL